MKTYPIFNKDHSVGAFEIKSAWVTFRPIYKILESIKEITEVKRQRFSEDRIGFKYKGIKMVINEPYGDSSRYWIGPKEGLNDNVNIEEIHQAFQKYESKFIRTIKKIIGRKNTQTVKIG
jgi:tryptophan 2,3-dioxygenase